ncbi:unnamed protein product, partial [Dicrocoelium dendriticum]
MHAVNGPELIMKNCLMDHCRRILLGLENVGTQLLSLNDCLEKVTGCYSRTQLDWGDQLQCSLQSETGLSRDHMCQGTARLLV